MSRFSLFRRHKPEAVDPDSSYTSGGSAPNQAGRKKTGKPSNVDDPVLPEKKRARRRLVGAVTITLAAIIVLPMVFDSEPQTVSQDMLIDIPSRDKPSQTISREPVKKKAEETVVADSDKPVSAPVTPVVSDKKETPKPDSTDKPATADSKPKPDAKSEPKPDAKTDAAQKTDDPIGQLIAKQGNTSSKDTSAKVDGQGKFVIQVAAVSSQEKAKELQDRLQKAGIASYAQKVALTDGTERIRIRIGPLSDRKEVHSTCVRLAKLKLSCTLVN